MNITRLEIVIQEYNMEHKYNIKHCAVQQMLYTSTSCCNKCACKYYCTRDDNTKDYVA